MSCPTPALYAAITPSGNQIVINIGIDSSTWNKCNADTQTGVLNILATEPIQLLGKSGKGNGIKDESGTCWVFHTQTKQRLATTGFVPWSELELQQLTFNRTYNH